MIERKRTSEGDVYYVGTFMVDDVILHFRFYSNEPSGKPRLVIDGRESAAAIPTTLSIKPNKSITQSERLERLRKQVNQIEKDYAKR